MKKLILFFALCCSMSAAQAQVISEAQEKINPAGRVILYEFRERQFKNNPSLGDQSIMSQPEEPTISAVVIMNKGYDADALAGIENVEILSALDEVIVVKCPLTMVEKIAALPEVLQIGFGDELRPNLDFARPASLVSNVQEGVEYEGVTKQYDGTGVICGMMDIGLVANHINFKNTDGTSRIKRLWHMTVNGAYDEYTDQTIGNFATDFTNEGHATHVGGIIGGGYKGNGKFYKLTTANGGSGSMQTNQPIPYYGVSTGADLAFAVGQLSTPNIIQGVTNIMNYANTSGKPVVVNLSLGSVIGPHDGSDYYSRSLAALGEKGIICMSAGNDGNDQISIVKELGSIGNDAYLRTIPVSVNPYTGSFNYGSVTGIADLWTNGSQPVTVSLKAFNGDAATAVEVMKIDASGTVSSSSSSNFSTYFSGSVTMNATVDYFNNRYNVYINFNGVGLATGNSARFLMLEVSGAEGTKLWLFGNGVFFDNKTDSTGATPLALTKGSAVASINDAACANNIISVGAYTTRTTWGRLDSGVYQYQGSGYTVGQISPFSSYGTSYQGTQLPLVCAPGANIISSYSSYYAGTNAGTTMCAEATVDGKTYYWGAMQGTSMSCPYVTGTIGLWLQADPSLNFSRALDVIQKTSSYNQLTMGGSSAKPRWGAGKIDALKGIQQVLADRAAALGNVWADDQQRLVITKGDGCLEVFVAAADQLTATLYDLQGRPVATGRGSEGFATVATSGLPRGLYILEARTPSLRLTQKLTL